MVANVAAETRTDATVDGPSPSPGGRSLVKCASYPRGWRIGA